MASSVNNRVFDYCAQRLDPEFIKQIRNDAGDADVRAPDVENYLKKGMYIPVLTAIWGERDQGRLVQWLRSHAEYHAPLMFERAIVEFEVAPTLQTVVRVSLPWLQAAAFRTYQDQTCLLNYSPDHTELFDTYRQLLKQKMGESGLDLEVIKVEYKDALYRNTFNWLSQFVNNVDTSTLPSPDWIGENSDGSVSPMIRLTKYDWVRECVGREALKQAASETSDIF